MQLTPYKLLRSMLAFIITVGFLDALFKSQTFNWPALFPVTISEEPTNATVYIDNGSTFTVKNETFIS